MFKLPKPTIITQENEALLNKLNKLCYIVFISSAIVEVNLEISIEV